MTDVTSWESGESLAEELLSTLLSLGARPRELILPEGYLERAEASLREIVLSPPATRRVQTVGRPSRGPLRLVAGLAAAAVAGIFAVVVVPGGGSNVAVAQTPALLDFELAPSKAEYLSDKPAVDALESVARTAAAQPAVAKGAVQFVTRDSWALSTVNDKAEDLTPVSRRQYFFDDTVRIIEQAGTPLDVTGRIPVETSLKGDAVSDESIPAEDPAELPATLPTDPAALTALVLADSDSCDGSAVSFCVTRKLTNLSNNYVLPPALLAALWRSLELPDVKYLGSVSDRLDRDAIGFSVPGSDSTFRTLLYADPKTGALLGYEKVLIKPDQNFKVRTPAIIEFNVIVESKRISEKDLPPAVSTR